jgi:hypothetical protein
MAHAPRFPERWGMAAGRRCGVHRQDEGLMIISQVIQCGQKARFRASILKLVG